MLTETQVASKALLKDHQRMARRSVSLVLIDGKISAPITQRNHRLWLANQVFSKSCRNDASGQDISDSSCPVKEDVVEHV